MHAQMQVAGGLGIRGVAHELLGSTVEKNSLFWVRLEGIIVISAGILSLQELLKMAWPISWGANVGYGLGVESRIRND